MEKSTSELGFPEQLILASQSPRRKELLGSIGAKFRVESSGVDELWPEHLKGREIAEYLAEIKAAAVQERFPDHVIISSDTIVVQDDQILEKPLDHNHAVEMLTNLSGGQHEVITGVCISSHDRKTTFSDTTRVTFKELTPEEIEYYVRNYQPFDKAGAYGIQEWIGMIGVVNMEGSYFNVMGLPVQKVYEALRSFDSGD